MEKNNKKSISFYIFVCVLVLFTLMFIYYCFFRFRSFMFSKTWWFDTFSLLLVLIISYLSFFISVKRKKINLSNVLVFTIIFLSISYFWIIWPEVKEVLPTGPWPINQSVEQNK